MARTEIPHAGNFSGSVDGMIRELTPDAMERIRAYQNDPNAGRPSNIFLISNGIIFSGSAPSTPSLPV